LDIQLYWESRNETCEKLFDNSFMKQTKYKFRHSSKSRRVCM